MASWKVTLRPYMKPVLMLSSLTKCNWLTDICYKREPVKEGETVTLNG